MKTPNNMNIIAKTTGLAGRVVCLSLLCCWLLPTLQAGEKNTKFLIVNSNFMVKKYQLIQDIFEEKLADDIKNVITYQVDLGSQWQDQDWLENMILDENPALIFCIGSKAYQYTRDLAGDTPVIFSFGINWRRLSVTDKTYVIATEIPAISQLLMYRLFFPDIKTIGVIYSPGHHRDWFQQARVAAEAVNIRLPAVAVKNNAEVETALSRLLPQTDALWLIPDPVVLAERQTVTLIFRAADEAGKPVFAYDKIFAELGAGLIISADIPTMAGQAAGIAADLSAGQKILKKHQQPAGSRIAINVQKLRRYGVKLNPGALSIVNEFIH